MKDLSYSNKLPAPCSFPSIIFDDYQGFCIKRTKDDVILMEATSRVFRQKSLNGTGGSRIN